MSKESFNTIFGEEIYLFPSPVTIVIAKPWNEVSEDQRILLSKILHAVKLSLESVRIIEQLTFDISSMEDKPSQMIVFVAPPKGLAMYELVQTGDTSVIFSDPLDNLISDDAAKRKLWGVLKQAFPG